jgi:hypothetical protein
LLPIPNFAFVIPKAQSMDTRNGNGSAGETVRLLNKKQIAAEIGVSGRTIDRWGFSGYIRRIIIGGRIYYSSAEVIRLRDRFIDSRPDARLMDSRIRYAGDIHEKYQDCLG